MKNIHLIPTDKPSRLIKDFNSKLLVNYNNVQFLRDGYEFQNIYITSDDKFIKDEYITDGNEVIKATPKLVNAQGLVDRRDWKKIILTTDELYIHNDLIPKEYNPFPQYIQKIDDEFLEWFVKNPSCEEVEISTYHIKGDISGKLYYKIIIPKEESFIEYTNTNDCTSMIYNPKEELKQENCCTPIGQIKRYKDCIGCDRNPKQETLEEFTKEVFEDEFFTNISEYKKAERLIEIGAKWQSKRMYSQEEVLAFGKSCFYKGFEKSEMDDANCYTAFREEIGFLFKQFKKK